MQEQGEERLVRPSIVSNHNEALLGVCAGSTLNRNGTPVGLRGGRTLATHNESLVGWPGEGVTTTPATRAGR